VGASGGAEHDDMTCAHVHDVAAELALGALTGRERADAIAHLERCRVCREDVRQLMVTGGQLLELLPPAAPSAGFETRVLKRLGRPASSEPQSGPRPLPGTGDERRPPRPRLPGDGGRPGQDRPPSETGTATGSGPGTGPGGTRPPGRVRRALAGAAMGLAVIAAGLGGWRVAVGVSPASATAARLTSASLLSATRGSVGNVFLYYGPPRWLYMDVNLGSGNDSVTCQVVGEDGRASTIGTFPLEDGYGAWGSPDTGKVGVPAAARLLAANGTVLATATFSA
jgi:hypothetical protein